MPLLKSVGRRTSWTMELPRLKTGSWAGSITILMSVLFICRFSFFYESFFSVHRSSVLVFQMGLQFITSAVPVTPSIPHRIVSPAVRFKDFGTSWSMSRSYR